MQERELPPLLPYVFTPQYEGGRRPSIRNTFTHQHPGMSEDQASIANYQEKGSSFQIRWIGDTIEPIPDIITNAMAEA
uniref:Uncharacterized protein n=1 Tax=Oryza glumipatula TaxID=40148 RepID=A0A0E0AGH8_9ORYZ